MHYCVPGYSSGCREWCPQTLFSFTVAKKKEKESCLSHCFEAFQKPTANRRNENKLINTPTFLSAFIYLFTSRVYTEVSNIFSFSPAFWRDSFLYWFWVGVCVRHSRERNATQRPRFINIIPTIKPARRTGQDGPTPFIQASVAAESSVNALTAPSFHAFIPRKRNEYIAYI